MLATVYTPPKMAHRLTKNLNRVSLSSLITICTGLRSYLNATLGSSAGKEGPPPSGPSSANWLVFTDIS